MSEEIKLYDMAPLVIPGLHEADPDSMYISWLLPDDGNAGLYEADDCLIYIVKDNFDMDKVMGRTKL